MSGAKFPGAGWRAPFVSLPQISILYDSTYNSAYLPIRPKAEEGAKGGATLVGKCLSMTEVHKWPLLRMVSKRSQDTQRQAAYPKNTYGQVVRQCFYSVTYQMHFLLLYFIHDRSRLQNIFFAKEVRKNSKSRNIAYYAIFAFCMDGQEELTLWTLRC